MPASVLDIFDTAVKIGLGAAITAIATHLHTRWSAKQESATERSRKRAETLEQIGEQVEEFTHVALSYWALISEWGAFQSSDDDMPEEHVSRLRDTREELTRAYKHLTVAESRLLLLGETAAQRLLREYGELITRFTRRNFIGGKPLVREHSLKWRAEILEARKQLFEELSRLYATLSV